VSEDGWIQVVLYSLLMLLSIGFLHAALVSSNLPISEAWSRLGSGTAVLGAIVAFHWFRLISREGRQAKAIFLSTIATLVKETNELRKKVDELYSLLAVETDPRSVPGDPNWRRKRHAKRN